LEIKRHGIPGNVFSILCYTKCRQLRKSHFSFVFFLPQPALSCFHRPEMKHKMIVLLYWKRKTAPFVSGCAVQFSLFSISSLFPTNSKEKKVIINHFSLSVPKFPLNYLLLIRSLLVERGTGRKATKYSKT